jgi:hypothetical protein
MKPVLRPQDSVLPKDRLPTGRPLGPAPNGATTVREWSLAKAQYHAVYHAGMEPGVHRSAGHGPAPLGDSRNSPGDPT